jgi:OOP family OmpA-OmpF porin
MAKDFLYRMNQTLPEMPLKSTIRSFGHWHIKDGRQTILHYGPTQWNRRDFQGELDAVPWGEGASPADQAIDQSSEDMNSMPGATAVILVGDGEYEDVDAVAAAERMKAKYGENVCIYTVQVGSGEADNSQIMQDIARVGECGFYQNYGNLATPQAIAQWVEAVFFGKANGTRSFGQRR